MLQPGSIISDNALHLIVYIGLCDKTGKGLYYAVRKDNSSMIVNRSSVDKINEAYTRYIRDNPIAPGTLLQRQAEHRVEKIGRSLCRVRGFGVGGDHQVRIDILVDGQWKELFETWRVEHFYRAAEFTTKELEVGDYAMFYSKDDFPLAGRVKSISPKGNVVFEGVKGWRSKNSVTPLPIQPIVAAEEVVKPVEPPPVKKPDIDDIVKEAVKQLNKTARGSVCSFMFVNKEGQKEFHTGAACHALLGYADRGHNGVHAIATNISKHYKETDAELKPAFVSMLDYLLNRSPWAPMYLTKDAEEACNSSVLMDVNKNHDLVVAASVALRQLWEHRQEWVLKTWNYLTSEGYGGHIAFIVATNSCSNGARAIPFDNNGWHHCMSSQHVMSSLKKLFNQGFKDLDKHPSKNGLRRYVIQTKIGEEDRDSKSSLYNVMASAEGFKLVNGAWGTRNVSHDFEDKEALKLMADQVRKHM